MFFKSSSCKNAVVGTSLENRRKDPIVENIVTRISRISTPRATLAAFALLVAVMTGFGLFVDGANTAESATVANETATQPAETLQTCALPSHVPLVPLVPVDRRTQGDSHVHA